MNRIRLLPEHVANQIAAGEVVERPASVVKELVENALDAQAARISVDVQAGGRSLIRVTDDGVGMGRDDALLCLERHATSKIRQAADLSAVATMGFRGEALPSIASVSRMLLTTREREGGAAATQVVIHGGKIVEVREAGAPPGTCMEVRQLFFNLPARRKFLRSEETEYAHIHHYLTLAALAFPEVAFTFTKDGRAIWQLPATPAGTDTPARLAALRDRLRGLAGSEPELLAVDESGALPGFPAATEPEALDPRPPNPALHVWGYIGKPGVSRATREDQHLFVNRRPVENRALNYALLEGYHTALMKGRYPVCCLFLELDPSHVDVNIHPAKREVKFHDERAVRQFVTEAIRRTLLKFHAGPAAPRPAANAPRLPQEPPHPTPSLAPTGAESARTAGAGPVQPGDARNAPGGSAPAPPSQPAPPAGQGPAVTRDLPSFTALTGSPLASRPAPVQAPGTPAAFPATPVAPPGTAAHAPPTPPAPAAAAPPAPAPAPGEPTPLLNVPLRMLGVVGRLYVVFESDRGLVLMDQHAAHERVLYEQTLNRLEREDAPSQRLLLPETVEASARDAQFLREHLPTLSRLGVGLSEFGERTFLLDALPPFVKVADARRFVLDLVDELKAAGQEVGALRLGEQTIAKTVCRHAVKANDPLAGPELESLVEELRSCAMPYTCPHGRPTLIEMSYRELEKKFGRQA